MKKWLTIIGLSLLSLVSVAQNKIKFKTVQIDTVLLLPNAQIETSDTFLIYRNDSVFIKKFTGVSSGADTFYVSYCDGCAMASGWRYSGDTIYIDTTSSGSVSGGIDTFYVDYCNGCAMADAMLLSGDTIFIDTSSVGGIDADYDSIYLDLSGTWNISEWITRGDTIFIDTTSGGGVTDHGALSGLGDDDHPQYQLDSDTLTWDATLSDLADTSAQLRTDWLLSIADSTYWQRSGTNLVPEATGDDILLPTTDKIQFKDANNFIHEDGTGIYGIIVDGQTAVTLAVNGYKYVIAKSTAFKPLTDSAIDLGASGTEFKDGYFDGILNVDNVKWDSDHYMILKGNTNSILNGSFESGAGTVADNWTATHASSYSRQDVVKYSGTYAISLTNATDRGAYSDAVTGIDKATMLSFYYRTQTTNTMKYGIKRDDGNYLQSDGVSWGGAYYFTLAATAGAWTNAQRRLETSSGNTYQIYFLNGAAVLAYVDLVYFGTAYDDLSVYGNTEFEDYVLLKETPTSTSDTFLVLYNDTIAQRVYSAADADNDSIYWLPNATTTTPAGWLERGDTARIDTSYVPSGVYQVVADSTYWLRSGNYLYLEDVDDTVAIGDPAYISLFDPMNKLTVVGNIGIAQLGDIVWDDQTYIEIENTIIDKSMLELCKNGDFELDSALIFGHTPINPVFGRWTTPSYDPGFIMNKVSTGSPYSGSYHLKGGVDHGGMAEAYQQIIFKLDTTELKSGASCTISFNAKADKTGTSPSVRVYVYGYNIPFQYESDIIPLTTSYFAYDSTIYIEHMPDSFIVEFWMWDFVSNNAFYLDSVYFLCYDGNNMNIVSDMVNIEAYSVEVDGNTKFNDDVVFYDYVSLKQLDTNLNSDNILVAGVSGDVALRPFSTLFFDMDSLWMRDVGIKSISKRDHFARAGGDFSLSLGFNSTADGDYSFAGGEGGSTMTCPTGVLTPDGSGCFVWDSVTVDSFFFEPVREGTNEPSYGLYGARIWDGSLYGGGRFTQDTAQFWKNRLDTVKVGTGTTIAGVWYGFSQCIKTTSEGTYYIGFAGDNFIRIKVNGDIVFNYSSTSTWDVYMFRKWWIIEVKLDSGYNFIELSGNNAGSEFAFGMEIFTTLDTIPPIDESGIGSLWRSDEEIGDVFDLVFYSDGTQKSGYVCPDGYTLNTCSTPPVCYKQIITEAIPTASTSKVFATGRTAFNFSTAGDSTNIGAAADRSAILGGLNHVVDTGAYNSAILGGNDNYIAQNAYNSVIIGGFDDSIATGVYNSVVLGGDSIVATESNTVYMPNAIADSARIGSATNSVGIAASGITLIGTADTIQSADQIIFKNSSGGTDYLLYYAGGVIAPGVDGGITLGVNVLGFYDIWLTHDAYIGRNANIGKLANIDSAIVLNENTIGSPADGMLWYGGDSLRFYNGATTFVLGRGTGSSITLPLTHENGGLEADVSAYNGLVKISGGTTSAATIGIANDNILEVDDASAADNDYAKFTANGLEGRSYSEVKTDLSLNNVENTALSTWTGSGNITTVGTIGTGTWQSTDVGVEYGGTGASSFTAYSVVTGGTTATGALQNVSGVGTSGQVLTSNGAGALPSWQDASGGGGTFTENIDEGTTSSIANAGYEELDIDIGEDQFIIDAVLIYATNEGDDVDVEFTVSIHQLDGGIVSAADGTHDIQSALRMIYLEEGVTLHNTQFGAAEAAGQSTLTVADATNLRKYDLLYMSDGADTDYWYRVSSVTSSTEIVIFDDLVAAKTDDSEIFQVYEIKNLGMYYDKSAGNDLHIGIYNTSGAARTFRVIVKTTTL